MHYGWEIGCTIVVLQTASCLEGGGRPKHSRRTLLFSHSFILAFTHWLDNARIICILFPSLPYTGACRSFRE